MYRLLRTSTSTTLPCVSFFRFALLTTVILVYLGFPSPVNAQLQQSGCGTVPYQDWYWVSSTEPFKTIRGTLVDRPHEYGEDSLWADYDWNFYVVPDDRSVLINSNKYANWNGQIEFEVCTFGWPMGVPDAFPPGSRIEAYGEWVEDYGHDPLQHDTPVPVPPDSDKYGGKTELHPLYWIKTLDQNPIKVFVAQDMSGRFVDAQNLLWQSVDYPTGLPMYPYVRPGIVPPSGTLVYFETASIARGVARNYASPEGYTVFVQLEPGYFSDCEDRARVYVPERSPHYLGSILKSSAPLLKETLQYSVSQLVDDPNHQKMASLRVEVELLDPPGSLVGMPDSPQVPILWSHWEYESSAGTTIGTVREDKTAAPHRLVFTMPYSPALGYKQSSWRMSVVGGTADNGPAEPLDYTSNLSRALVTEGRTYAILPSHISLSTTEKWSGGCPRTVYLTIDKSKLLPDVGLWSLEWRVKVLRDVNGQTVQNPSEVLISPGSLLETQGFSIQTYPHPNEERLDVIWKKLASPNLAKVQVIARGVTELGEEVSATSQLDAICSLGSYTRAQIMEYSYRFMVFHKIRGELYDPRTLRTLTAEDRQWLVALGKFRRGEPLTQQEMKLLLDAALKGATLPEIKHRSLQPKSPR